MDKNVTYYNQKLSYSAIDFYKMIFSLAVVAIHIDPLIELKGSIFYDIYYSFIYLAVPFFFTVSGFLIANDLEFRGYDNELSYLKKQIIKYIKLTRCAR